MVKAFFDGYEAGRDQIAQKLANIITISFDEGKLSDEMDQELPVVLVDLLVYCLDGGAKVNETETLQKIIEWAHTMAKDLKVERNDVELFSSELLKRDDDFYAARSYSSLNLMNLQRFFKEKGDKAE